MAVTVGTDSYVTEAELTAYATTRGITIASDLSVLLIKSMDFLETRKWKGYKTVATQSLEWPRTLYSNGTWTLISDSYYVDPLIVPNDIKRAQIVGALLIDQGNDLQPIVKRLTKREKVDVLEVEYQNGSSTTFYTALNDLIAPYMLGSLGVTRV